MNRYPLWKYLVIAIALLIGVIYSLPNLFGESPAIQISGARVTSKVDLSTQQLAEQKLLAANITSTGSFLENTGSSNTLKIRFKDADTQLKAKDIIEHAINADASNPEFIVALNLLSNTPNWLLSINALSMPLGLDLRGGVYFLLQVDMKGALEKKIIALINDSRSRLREKSIRYQGLERINDTLSISLANEADANRTIDILKEPLNELNFRLEKTTEGFKVIGTLSPQASKAIQQNALQQNILTLNKRVNELAVKEPVIQKQGDDRIVVQLPGVQDTARAKDIIGRTATLEARLADPVQPYIGLNEAPPRYGCLSIWKSSRCIQKECRNYW
jgi:preprotein translocase subunit SecD